MGYHHDVDVWYLNGNYLLGLMVLCVHLPLGKYSISFCEKSIMMIYESLNDKHHFLGLFRRIDFLGFTSFIGMACMSTFVIMVIKKQPQAKINIYLTDFFLLKYFNINSNPKIRLTLSVAPSISIIRTRLRRARLNPSDSTEVPSTQFP